MAPHTPNNCIHSKALVQLRAIAVHRDRDAAEQFISMNIVPFESSLTTIVSYLHYLEYQFADLLGGIATEVCSNLASGLALPREKDWRWYQRLWKIMCKVEELRECGLIDSLYSVGFHIRNELFKQFQQRCRYILSRHPGRTRYQWKSPDGQLVNLFMPLYLKQKQRWLEENVHSIDSNLPFREAVQELIDERFGTQEVLSLSIAGDSIVSRESSPSEQCLDELKDGELADAVATHKVENLDSQRSCVRELGKERLRKLIVKVFDAIGSNCVTDREIAVQFGLSKSGFSRFCGSRWLADKEINHIPDLWRNCAYILCHEKRFREAALSAGVMEVVSSIVGTDHE